MRHRARHVRPGCGCVLELRARRWVRVLWCGRSACVHIVDPPGPPRRPARLTRLVALLVVTLWTVACAAPPVRDIRTTVTEITVPGASTMVGNADGSVTITRPADPPAESYPLALGVVGTGTATGAGQYAAGVTVPVSVAPTPSTASVQWSGPAPCPQTTSLSASLVMPPNALTCTVTVSSGPPPSGAGTWTLTVTGSGVYNWYYNLGSVCPDGQMWIAWSGVTNRLPVGATAWLTETTTTSMGWRENFATACTEDNTVWIAPGTSGPPEWSGFVTYGLASKTYTKLGGGGCNAHSVLGYDPGRKRLLTFGGWSTNCAIMARSTTSATAAWVPLNASGPVPPLTQDDARETSRRGGVDQRTGDAWVLADNRALYRYSAAANAWAAVATTGTTPPPYVVAALHESANTIVAVGGCDGLNDSDCSVSRSLSWWEQLLIFFGKPAPLAGGQTSRGTWLLDLSTGAWRVGPTQSPEAMPMSKRHAVYDKAFGRVVLFTATGNPTSGGKLGTNVWAWTPSAGPVPPPVTYGMRTETTGNGTGSITGAGQYAAGAMVTLVATPAAGSVFAGWTEPTPCAQSPFPMPAGPLTCTGRFNLGQPPPTATCTPRLREWVECITPPTGNPFPNDAAGSKDINWAWDTVAQRLIFGAGDIKSSGVADLYALNLPAGTWEPMSVGCRPAGQVMLNHPSDRGPFIVDKRGEYWIWNGVPYPNQEGQACGANGAIQKAGLLKRATSGVWTQATATKTASLGGGAYDSTADALLHFEPGAPCSGNPGTLVRTLLPSLTQSSSPLCIGVTWSGSTGGWVAPEQPERVFFAWDDVGRKAYVIAPRIRYDAPGNVVERVASLSVFDAAAGTWAQKRSAPTGNSALVPYHTAAVWDGVNKRVLYPLVDNPCGEVRALYAYDPATDAWETFDVPASVHGSTVAFDPRANALVVAGSVFCTGYAQKAIYLWRYADAPAGRATGSPR